MFTTGSKTLIGGAVLATLASVLYGVTQSGVRGTIGLISAAVALATLAGLNVALRDSNVFVDDPAPVESTSAAQRPAGTSVWPLGVAFSGVVIVVGLVSFQPIVVIGLAALLATGAEWTVQAWAERASSDSEWNAGVRSRLANSLEYPIAAAAGIGIIVFAFSRVMLWLGTKTGTTITFSVLATVVLIVAFAFAGSRKVQAGAIGGTVALGAVVVVAAGTAAGLDGERDIPVFETTSLWMQEANEHPEEYAVGAAEGKHPEGFICESPEKFPEADKKASQTVSLKANAVTVLLTEDGLLELDVPGPLEDGAQGLTIPRSNPTNIIFKNESGDDVRLSADLGVDDDEFRDMECTPLVEETGSQVLTLTVGKASFAAEGVTNGPTADAADYWLFVPGVDTAKLRLIVP
ncbi:MAG: hypothetical protein AAGG08_08690 [Actinomycetota bacterium]